MLCKIARKVLNSIKWIWLIPITTILATYIANEAPTSMKDFANSFPGSVFGWLILGPYRVYTFVGLGLLIALPLAAWIVTLQCQEDIQTNRKNDTGISIEQYHDANSGTVQLGKDNSTMIGPYSTIIQDSIVHFDNMPYGTKTNQKWAEEASIEKDNGGVGKSKQIDSAIAHNPQLQVNPTSVQPGTILATDGNRVLANVTLEPPLPEFKSPSLEELDLPNEVVRLTSSYYIKREDIDNIAEKAILKDGITISVKGSKQVGKTSLLARLKQHALDNSHPVVYINFHTIENDHFSDFNTLLLTLANKIAAAHKISKTPDYYWESAPNVKNLGPIDKLTIFLTEEVLGYVTKPFVLILDQVDRIFDFVQYRDDFFRSIRSWDSSRASDENLNKLNVVLAYSTEASLDGQTPFNVGIQVQVADFNRTEVEELNLRHKKPVRTEEMDSFIDFFGGHPYLVRAALYVLVSEGLDLKGLVQKVYTVYYFTDHLDNYRRYLQERPALSEAMKSVIYKHTCADEDLFKKLIASGLVRGPDRNDVQPRCGLYAHYFRNLL